MFLWKQILIHVFQDSLHKCKRTAFIITACEAIYSVKLITLNPTTLIILMIKEIKLKL